MKRPVDLNPSTGRMKRHENAYRLSKGLFSSKAFLLTKGYAMKIVSQNFYEYPPYMYLFQVLQHCPKAGLTYMEIWRHRDKNSSLTVYKDSVREEFLVSLAKFRHDILLLVKEGLVNVDETPNTMKIELVDYQEG